jgi:hypothetical protein
MLVPPIGASDHDIVYSEINLALLQNKQQAHKVLNYKKAQWDRGAMPVFSFFWLFM